MALRKRRNFVWTTLIIALFSFNILAWIVVYDLNKTQFLEVNFFDVGQGDAIFIETPKRQQILIDGGPDSIILAKLAKEMPFWDRSIDLLILTHPERDHLIGLIEVLKRYKIDYILWTGIVKDTSEFQEWERLIEEEKEKEGAQIKIARVGQRISCLTWNVKQWAIEILYPFENLEGKVFKDSNNTSIIAKLIFKENSFLFSGDAYKSVEREILDKGANINSDVLKVGHHGSKTSSSEEFIARVSPKIAVILAGKENPYGHPHREVLETLTKYGIKILTTAKNGDIKIISDGITLRITNQN